MPNIYRLTVYTAKLPVMRATATALVISLLVTIVSPFAAMASADTLAATDNNASVNANEVASALAHTDGVLAASDQTKVASDSDSAIQATTAGATIDIPKDASDGVTLGSTATGAPSLDISLPNATSAADAKQVAPGTVAYAGSNGSANAVQATEDGGVRMLTIIDSPSAPTAYDYKVTVPSGGHIELSAENGAIVLDSEGSAIARVLSPWARDATGRQIETYFTTDGSTLTQHVLHDMPGVVYPITADPWFFNYFGCILGIGVPFSAAVIIASFPPSWYWISRIATGTAGSGRVNGLVIYASWVKTRCAAFIHG